MNPADVKIKDDLLKPLRYSPCEPVFRFWAQVAMSLSAGQPPGFKKPVTGAPPTQVGEKIVIAKLPRTLPGAQQCALRKWWVLGV